MLALQHPGRKRIGRLNVKKCEVKVKRNVDGYFGMDTKYEILGTHTIPTPKYPP